jgi:hypothetical protein
MEPLYLDVFPHIATRRRKILVVSTTNETATSCSHADSAMIKLATIPWKGKFHSLWDNCFILQARCFVPSLLWSSFYDFIITQAKIVTILVLVFTDFCLTYAHISEIIISKLCIMSLGKQHRRWCAWYAWRFNLLAWFAKPHLAMGCPWQNITVTSAKKFMTKGNIIQRNW